MVFPRYYIGTAGWSYKDWVPSFYPKQQSGKFDWVQFYSHYFNCVEVNSTYYAYLSPKIVEGWVKKVADSDEFIFHIKLHQDFTHRRKFDEQSIKAVRYNLDVLYYEWESRALQAMTEAMEDRAPGRPGMPQDEEKHRLQQEIAELKEKLFVAEKTVEVRDMLHAYEVHTAKTKRNESAEKKRKRKKRR